MKRLCPAIVGFISREIGCVLEVGHAGEHRYEPARPHRCDVPIGARQGLHGPAIDECTERSDGELRVSNGDYCYTQVNFCPFCGFKARKQIQEVKMSDDPYELKEESIKAEMAAEKENPELSSCVSTQRKLKCLMCANVTMCVAVGKARSTDQQQWECLTCGYLFYSTTIRMTFGEALEELKAGKRVARQGWNGKGMWLVLIHAGNAMHTSAAGGFDMQDCIGIKTTQGTMQPGWLASQADMLAEDWKIIEP